MKLFECRPVINQYSSISEFFDAAGLGADDLIITNRYILDGEKVDIRGAQIIYQEMYGNGEPSDEMLMSIRAGINRPYLRVIGVGGGTVLDLGKLLCLDLSGIDNTEQLGLMMSGKLGVKKKYPVLLVPTTCGTGSEVTSVAVLLLKAQNIKLGLADPALLADEAALIPDLLRSLPYKPMILSAIDALIHAVESFLSPKANPITQALSVDAVKRLLKAFVNIKEPRLDEMLIASNTAGIAFNNAGCGMVHAMSYPVGGMFHLPHGESNYEVFLPVLRYYDSLEQKAPLEALKTVIADVLDTDDPLGALEELLKNLYPRRALREIGANDEMLKAFSDDVFNKQQRLLRNAMQPVSRDEILKVYLEA